LSDLHAIGGDVEAAPESVNERVKPIPGLEHLPFAEVWFREVGDRPWREASSAASAIGKSGLEVWTTDASPAVIAFLEDRGYEQVRRYVISELDVAAAPAPAPPAFPHVTFAERPDLVPELYAIAVEAYPDQPGRSETQLGSFEEWRSWGLDPHPADAYFIAVEGGRVLGYGLLEVDGDTWSHGFMAIARRDRGRGVAGAIKRAQIAWAKQRRIEALRTATELRLVHMRALNERLGYRRLYEEVVLRGPVATA
jgi:GNAT superfamily N-acetyltransferase